MIFSSGIWTVGFAGKQLKMPLRADNLGLDWDAAVSICGHDIEVKQTYSYLIQSTERPQLFLDIGANYGTHSLLFLVHGIDTITFEPNASCHDDFRFYCQSNNVKARIESVALGERDGLVDLWYPADQTWLGTTDKNVHLQLKNREALHCEVVVQKAVDDYIQEYGDRRLLIKIDTEGNECAILRGAYRTLAEKRPVIIFESWADEKQRDELFDTFSKFNYRIAQLPWSRDQPERRLTCPQFLETPATNFIALPNGVSE